MTPRESMPETIQTPMPAAPDTYHIILSQIVPFRGAGAGTVWPRLSARVAIGAGLVLQRFRKFLK